MFKFKITKHAKNSLARRGEITTACGKIQTPVFMPCATVGAVKGVSAEELKEIGYNLILSNTYHLYLRPGDSLIKKNGGLQKFMNWPGAILTDSGGYQVFSLGANFNSHCEAGGRGNLSNKKIASLSLAMTKKRGLVKIQKNGVIFRSHLDGSKHEFTPEKVIDIQRNLGSDIMMVLDVCTEHPATRKKAAETMELTHAWAKKAIDYWTKIYPNVIARSEATKQSIFGIVQGSTYKDLREKSAQFISNLPFDGIAVGGVSVGEGKANMYKVMKWVGPLLPKDKPHYLMGVGEPEDILEAVKQGFDMFDCVLPTRLGRHGMVWVTSNFKKFSKIDLRKSQCRTDKKIIMKNCHCPACAAGYSRAYISHLIREKEMLGLRLASLHNLYILHELMRRIGEGI